MALVGDIYCILLLSNVVSWVRCDTLLYSFLIFPSFLTLQRHHVVTNVKWNKTRITAYGKCEIAKRRYRKFAKAMYVKVALYKSFNSSIYANLRWRKVIWNNVMEFVRRKKWNNRKITSSSTPPPFFWGGRPGGGGYWCFMFQSPVKWQNFPHCWKSSTVWFYSPYHHGQAINYSTGSRNLDQSSKKAIN